MKRVALICSSLLLLSLSGYADTQSSAQRSGDTGKSSQADLQAEQGDTYAYANPDQDTQADEFGDDEQAAQDADDNVDAYDEEIE